jgi:hypothetical protein
MLPGDIYDALVALPENFRNSIIIKALAEGKVSYDVVARGYVEYIKALKERQSEDYNRLQQLITHTFTDDKKNIRQNLAKCIRYLDEKGRINLIESLEKRLEKYEEYNTR